MTIRTTSSTDRPVAVQARAGRSAPRCPLSRMATQIGTEPALEVLARCQAAEAGGRTISHLEVGDLDWPTPTNIIDAAVASLRAGETHYGPAPGLPELRRLISRRYRALGLDDRGPDSVLVGPGSRALIFSAILAVVDPGDQVLIPSPGYPLYGSGVAAAGGVQVPYSLRCAGDRFRTDLDELESLLNPYTRMIVLNSPHNPTGSVLTPGEFSRIRALAAERGIWLLIDEVYDELVYDDVPGAAWTRGTGAPAGERLIVVNGFSKAHAMTGWRCGYCLAPPVLMPALERFAINAFACVPTFVQRAAIEALSSAEYHVPAFRQELRERRDLLASLIGQSPQVRLTRPAGGLYLCLALSGISGRALVERLMDEHGVAALTGTSFGSTEQLVRLSFCASKKTLAHAGSVIDKVARELTEELSI